LGPGHEVFVGGVHVMLAAGLPHARDTLQRIHIATPGMCVCFFVCWLSAVCMDLICQQCA
jgi:hypothetical protein